jgi:hypothetical protein
MATQPAYDTQLTQPAQNATTRGLGVLERLRADRTERRQARPVSARGRRVLAENLRVVARQAIDPDPIRRRHDVLLHFRAAAVRTDLLEIAAMLERTNDPDPACVKALHELLTIGCDSPLYNAGIDVSELQSTLDYIRCGL